MLAGFNVSSAESADWCFNNGKVKTFLICKKNAIQQFKKEKQESLSFNCNDFIVHRDSE